MFMGFRTKPLTKMVNADFRHHKFFVGTKQTFVHRVADFCLDGFVAEREFVEQGAFVLCFEGAVTILPDQKNFFAVALH